MKYLFVDFVTILSSQDFHVQPLIPIESANPRQIEKVLKDIHRESTKRLEEIGHKGKYLQLLIIILPDVTGSYGENQTRTKRLSLLARKLIFYI